MDAGIEKECSALGGLFQLIMNDMKASYPTWEDFLTKGAKLQSQLRTTIVVTGAFLDAFQKVADMATGTRGATKEIGSALTRMCMRHRSIESKLKLFTTALSESLITPLELKMEEWKKVASQLDKDHAKEYKKARADIKKKSSDTIKLQKKVKKGKDEARGQLDSALQDVNVRYAVLEETEKRAVCKALIEERARYCSFVTMLKPVLDHEINMLGEVTHLQTILEDLTNLTAEPNKLPPASEQVILDLKGSDFNYTYQTPPASPSNTLSRKSSIIQQTLLNNLTLFSLSLNTQSCSARDQLALTLGALNSDAPRSSRDSLHCSSGYSTQTTTPSCSEDTIHTHIDYDQSDFDKSSTIPRNSDLSLQYRKFAQSKRPASTVSLLAEPELIGGSVRQLPSHTATIRRKPSSKPGYRRGTISGGVPIPICTPQVPLKVLGGNTGSDENVFTVPSAGGAGGLGYNKLCTSTQSLSALPPSSSSSSSPYYQLVPGQMPIPVPVPTVPSLPSEQQQQRQYQQQLQPQQQINQLNHQLQQHNQQLQLQQQHYYQQQQQLQQLFQQQQQLQQQQQPLLQQPQRLQHQQDQYAQTDQHQQQLNRQQKQKLFQQQHQAQFQAPAAQGQPSNLACNAHYEPQPPLPSNQNLEPLSPEGGGDMLTLIRGVTLKRTVTNDRSAPLLPSPTNHK
uniref:MTSS I-BAR domain containing 1 n=1 Tax=Mastacembelus armatus TaxID=205130 RepID=A0A7N9AV13_9TELE